jgi:hypothetical protein
MKLEPLIGWMIGRIAITKVSSTIVTPDANRGVTKFVLVDAVSPEAEAKGFKPGDLVMPKTMHNIFLKGGLIHRVTFPLEETICKVHGVSLAEFIGSDGKELVGTPTEVAA